MEANPMTRALIDQHLAHGRLYHVGRISPATARPRRSRMFPRRAHGDLPRTVNARKTPRIISIVFALALLNVAPAIWPAAIPSSQPAPVFASTGPVCKTGGP